MDLLSFIETIWKFIAYINKGGEHRMLGCMCVLIILVIALIVTLICTSSVYYDAK